MLDRSEPDSHLKPLRTYLTAESGPGPGSFLSINSQGIKLAADLLGLKPALTMSYLLKQGIWPRRFSRNRGVLKDEEQAALLESKAVVIGCGGLGGHVSTLLARLGLGALVLCDYDCFEESNLNRQLFSRETNLGRNKAKAAAEEISSLASHIEITVWPEAATASNLPEIIRGSTIVMDCLDTIAARLELETASHNAGLPFVYGAIAGEEGFAMVTRPGEVGLSALYGDQPETEAKNAEKRLGVPTITPSSLACLQVHLAVKTLLGREPPPPALYHLDLSVPSVEALYF